jgi:hypothetical protein
MQMKIEGFFSGIKNANEAVQKLKKAGINNSYVDLNEHYMTNNNTESNLAGNSTTPSLSDLVLRSGDPSGATDKAPLLAASPMVSGMGGFEEIMDVNYKVVANIDESSKSEASRIIQSAGGSMESPNLNLPDRIKDMKLRNVELSDLDSGNTTDIGMTT